MTSTLKLNVPPQRSVIYRALYQQIRDQILNGHLVPGARLPSSRALAAELGCSRGSVERAFELLLAEGFIQGQGAAGTRVNPKLDPGLIATGVIGADRQRSNQSKEEQVKHHSPPLPLRMGLPALDAFPRKLWNRLINKHARSTRIEALARGDAFGYRPLRDALANYLAISRGVNTAPEQIFISIGFQGALSTIIQCLSNKNDQIWCEDPGYYRARDSLAQLGVAVVPVSVDENGLRIQEGIKRAPNSKFALVTPTHQSPTGVKLSLARRMELLHWAESQGSWIIEDDYDSEFRYGETPLPALKSLDANNRVIYTGSFSKVLAPSLALGYIVVPQPLQPIFENSFSALWSAGSLLEQKVLAEFIAEGHFSLHIKKMRKLYGERRAALATQLNWQLADELSISLQAGGMHLIGELINKPDETRLRQAAAARDIGLNFLSSFQIETTAPSAVLLSFTNVDVASAKHVVARLAKALAASKLL
ncbi:MAG: PLP-dependent aminotransferase family protein [Pseudomonadales bacterium]|nr:PLP-dependent aminotransferase family protein [Pseudomonadales bacterium]